MGFVADDGDGIGVVEGAEFGADIVIEGGEAGGVVDTFERLEIEFSEVDAVPVEAVGEIGDAFFHLFGALGIGEVHEFAPIELGVLEEGGFFAPFGVIGPELFGDVGEFDPGVDENGATVGGFDEFVEVFVALGIGVVIVPGGDVEGSDAGGAPAFGEVIGVGAEAVGGVKEGPEAAGFERGFEAKGSEGLQDVGEAFVAILAGGDVEPEDGAAAEAETGGHGSVGPAFAGEDFGRRRDGVDGEIERAFPDDGERFVVGIANLAGLNSFYCWGEAEGSGEFGIAFEDEESALLNAGAPIGGSGGGAGWEDDYFGDAVGGGGHSDGLENGGPGAGVVAGDVEMEGWLGGGDGECD